MKKIFTFFIAAVISCCFGVSCEKNEMGDKHKIGSMEDLLGTYYVIVEDYVVWGSDSGTIHDKGTITITQIDEDRVKLSGLISTKGRLVDGKLYLDSTTNTDSYGYITRNYDSALFGAGILTIFSKATGQLSTTPNGTRYPYSSNCYFEGRKVE
ncbi:MAG: hypothetical protein IJ942_01045 [Alistipes sp.]|nr:hypothetical protein [Alistipes sp.]